MNIVYSTLTTFGFVSMLVESEMGGKILRTEISSCEDEYENLMAKYLTIARKYKVECKMNWNSMREKKTNREHGQMLTELYIQMIRSIRKRTSTEINEMR